MLNYIIPLLESWLPIWNNYLVPVLALCFISFVPTLIRSFLRG